LFVDSSHSWIHLARRFFNAWDRMLYFNDDSTQSDLEVYAA